MRNKSEKNEAATGRAETKLRESDKAHTRSERARRYYSAEITGSERSDAANVKPVTVAPIAGSADGKTANGAWRVEVKRGRVTRLA